MSARRVALFFRALVIVLAAGGSALQAESPEASIGTALDALHAAAARADGERYFALFAQDAVFIGTDAGERWPIAAFRSYADPYFSAGKGWVYHPRERHVTLAACGCIAWFDELLDSESYGTSRGTGVLVLRDTHWKVAQYALSFPIPNDLASGITAQIRAWERTHGTP